MARAGEHLDADDVAPLQIDFGLIEKLHPPRAQGVREINHSGV